MPQSEKNGEKRRGDKEEEWQSEIRKKKKTGRVRKSRVVAVDCSYQRQLEWETEGKEKWGHEGTIPNPWGNILSPLQNGRCRIISGCLHKRVNTHGFHSKVYNIKDVHNSHILFLSSKTTNKLNMSSTVSLKCYKRNHNGHKERFF